MGLGGGTLLPIKDSEGCVCLCVSVSTYTYRWVGTLVCVCEQCGGGVVEIKETLLLVYIVKR